MAPAAELHSVGTDDDSSALFRQSRLHGSARRDPGRGYGSPVAQIHIRTRPHRGGSDDGGLGYPVHVPARTGLHRPEKRVPEANEGDPSPAR